MKLAPLLLLLLTFVGFISCSDDDMDTTYNGKWVTISDNIQDSGHFTARLSIPGYDTTIIDDSITLFNTSLHQGDSASLSEVTADSFFIWFPTAAGDTTVYVASHFDEWKQSLGIDSLEQIIDSLPTFANVVYQSAAKTPNLTKSSVDKKLSDDGDTLTLTFEQNYRLEISFIYSHIIIDTIDSPQNTVTYDTVFTYDTSGTIIDTTFRTMDTLPIPGSATYASIRTITYTAETYDGIIPPSTWPSTTKTLAYDDFWERIINKL